MRGSLAQVEEAAAGGAGSEEYVWGDLLQTADKVCRTMSGSFLPFAACACDLAWSFDIGQIGNGLCKGRLASNQAAGD
jgi:hypothetical protein